MIKTFFFFFSLFIFFDWKPDVFFVGKIYFLIKNIPHNTGLPAEFTNTNKIRYANKIRISITVDSSKRKMKTALFLLYALLFDLTCSSLLLYLKRFNRYTIHIFFRCLSSYSETWNLKIFNPKLISFWFLDDPL